MTNSKLIQQRITAEVIALFIAPFQTMVDQRTCVANSPKKSGVIEKFSETRSEAVEAGVRRKHRKAHDPCLPRAYLEGRPALLQK